MSVEKRGARRVVAGRRVYRQRTPAAACRPMASALEARPAPLESAPIWFAALAGMRCHAADTEESRSVRFEYVAGRALYTNCSPQPESIHPLGVTLLGGQTLAVYWVPGESGYTLEVYRREKQACA